MAVLKNAKKVLIVDDEKAISKALSLKLTNSGFIVDSAGDGAEAVAKIKAEKFDLVILDLIMPGDDGFSVLEYLYKEKIKPPVIIASNLSQSEDINKAKALGAVDYFIKSNVTLADIISNIKKILKV